MNQYEIAAFLMIALREAEQPGEYYIEGDTSPTGDPIVNFWNRGNNGEWVKYKILVKKEKSNKPPKDFLY